MFRKLLLKRALLSVAIAGTVFQTTIICELPNSIVIGISGDGYDDDDDWDDDDHDDDDWDDDCCYDGDWYFDWWW